jgi:alpha-glucosidase (family GH31 glycosyl hydrolase)
VDWWTGERYEGGRTLNVSVPIEHISLFVRVGAMLPRMEAAERVPSGLIDPLILGIYPSANSSYTFREDEGTTEFRFSQENGELSFAWEGGPARRMVVSFRSPRCTGIIEAQMDGRIMPPGEIPWYVEGGKMLCSLPKGERGSLLISLRDE